MNNASKKLCTIAVIIPLIAMVSCNPSQKAHKYFNEHRKEFATDCNDAFPIHIGPSDSTDFKKSLAVIDSLTNEYQASQVNYEKQRQDLLDEIATLNRSESLECNSLQEGLYRLVAIERTGKEKAERQANNLTNQLRNIKPVHDTVESKAGLQELQNKIDAKDQIISDRDKTISENNTEIKSLKGKLKSRSLIMWALILLIIGAGGYKLYTMFKPKIKT